MNDEVKFLSRIITYIGLLLAPTFALLLIYFYFENIARGLKPSLKAVIITEVLIIGYGSFAYWLIKRMGWDFWKKDKPQKNKLSSKEKWWEEKD